MSGRVGLELTPAVVRVVRAARRPGGAPRSLELPWDPRRPGELVAALVESLGRPAAVHLAVGFGFRR